MSSEVPKWLEDAARKCKEGDDRACEVVRRYMSMLEKEYLQSRSILTGSTFATVLSAIVTILFKVGLGTALLIAFAFFSQLILSVVDVYRRRKLLEKLYNIFIDPRMDDRYLIIGAIIAAILAILAIIISHI